MSKATLERAIVAGARLVLKNPALKPSEILEWSTVDLGSAPDEISVLVPDPGVYVVVKKGRDKR
jgi:hypothetical protein